MLNLETQPAQNTVVAIKAEAPLAVEQTALAQMALAQMAQAQMAQAQYAEAQFNYFQSENNAWMFIRAQHEYLFMFGQPKTLKEFIYHISGATYLENITSGSEQIVNLRIPYFLKLTTLQLFIFIPFFIAGIVIILKKKLFPLFTIIILYFLFIFFYQLNNNQWGSTDAYLLLPFMVLYFGAFYGAIYYSNNIKIQHLLKK